MTGRRREGCRSFAPELLGYATDQPVSGPRAWLLDGRAAGLDEVGLRAWARAEGEASGARHVSRAYRHPFAVVAWHEQPVGVDIERIERHDPRFAASIATPAEAPEVARRVAHEGYVSALWSGKEALAKALGDAVDYDPQRLESPLCWPGHRAGGWRAAPLATPGAHVGWLVWRETAGPDDRPRLS